MSDIAQEQQCALDRLMGGKVTHPETPWDEWAWYYVALDQCDDYREKGQLALLMQHWSNIALRAHRTHVNLSSGVTIKLTT